MASRGRSQDDNQRSTLDLSQELLDHPETIDRSAARLLQAQLDAIARRTDLLFSGLLLFQWVVVVVTALLDVRRTSGEQVLQGHLQVGLAILLGGLIAGLPMVWVVNQPGKAITRHLIAVAQSLMGALLIHLSGGRTETHFHIFGSLALLAFYHDWRVLVTASVVVAIDHMLRGLFWPQSVFGTLTAEPWQWAEHLGWVMAEDFFLIRSCFHQIREMRASARREAELSRANEELKREVIDRKRAEEGQARLVATLDATTDFVGIADANGRALYVNEAGQRMIGLSKEKVPQTSIPDYLPAQTIDIVLNEGLTTAIREGVWSHEAALRRCDGSEIPASMVVVAHKDSQGNLEFFSTFVRDITAQKQAEMRLLRARDELEVRVAERTAELIRTNQELEREIAERKEAEKAQARLVAILNATTDFVGIADMEGKPLYVNEAGLRMVGIHAEDLPHLTIAEFHPDWSNEIITKESMPCSFRDGAWSGEIAFRRRDGSEIPVSMVGIAHRDPQGDLEFTSIIARDISERKQAEQAIRLLNSQLECRLNRLKSLREIDQAITARLDLEVTLDLVLDQVRSHLGVDAANVLHLDPHSQMLRSTHSKGFQTSLMPQIPLELKGSIPGQVALECRSLHLAKLSDSTQCFVRHQGMAEEGFVAYSAVPFCSQGVVKGVLEVFHRTPLEVDQEWLDFLESLAGQAAIAIDNATLFEDLQRTNVKLTMAYDATIEGWSRALDLRDKETEGHTRRVTEMSVQLATAMGMSGADLVNVRRGALLHDIGKLGIPDAILLKPGPLTAEEWELMRRHPTYAYEWLAPISFLRPALDIPYCHHEKVDGTGYPRGLKGNEIPLAARIFAVVDIWDALRSDRPYRKGWSEERIIKHIKSLSNNHLDPRVVETFVKHIAVLRSDRRKSSEPQGHNCLQSHEADVATLLGAFA